MNNSMKQIAARLNECFTGSQRRIVFWYDEKQEFTQEIHELHLDNAHVWILQEHTQFAMKYRIERVEPNQNILIYAPFRKPPIYEDALADTLRYSQEFSADRLSALTMDLGISQEQKQLLEPYQKFFMAEERVRRFSDLLPDSFDKHSLEITLLSTLCKLKTPSFEEVVRVVLSEGTHEENRKLKEFEKYQLTDAFWTHCLEEFGTAHQSLSKLTYTLFVTCTLRTLKCSVPPHLRPYVSEKTGSAAAFLDSMMNSVVYADSFEALAEETFQVCRLQELFMENIEALCELELFSEVDRCLIHWIIEQLLHEQTSAALGEYSIPELCTLRKRKHYGKQFLHEYTLLENAFALLGAVQLEFAKDCQGLIQQYCTHYKAFDTHYRKFYVEYDQLAETHDFEPLSERIENIYTHHYLNPLNVHWTELYQQAPSVCSLVRQSDFYKRYVQPCKEKTAVFISDALRYECGAELAQRLSNDERCTVELKAMLSVLPSITSMGMTALLPHKQLTFDAGQPLADGFRCMDRASREAQLKRYEPQSKAIQFDELCKMKSSQLKEYTSGVQVLYIYHNQIDARGDHASSENEVFVACEEAIDELYKVVSKLSSANITHALITADHGFLYKRSPLAEADKIDVKQSELSRRYLLDTQPSTLNGTCSFRLDENYWVITPKGSDVFKKSGAGQNYVHGGASMQEMILPMIDVKLTKGRTETRVVKISLISNVSRITNKLVKLNFIQEEAVSDIVKPTTYRIRFVDEQGELIANEAFYQADSQDREQQVFTLVFNFKDKEYSKLQRYYLVIVDENTGIEMKRMEVMMDILFNDGFDFGF